MQVGKGMIEEFWWNADSGSLEEEASIYRQFVQGSPKMSGNHGDLLSVVWPTPKD